MSYGLSIYNAYGNIIISEAFQNYHLISSGAVTNEGSLPTPAATELLMVRPSTLGALMYASSSSGSSVKVNTGYIEWVLLRREIPPSSISQGLRVFDTQGKVCFDSGVRALVPVSVHRMTQGTDDSSLSISQPFAPTLNRKRYLNLSSLRDTGLADDGSGYVNTFRMSGILWSSDTNMTLREGVLARNPGPFVDWAQSWASTMVFSFADV